MKSVNLAPEIIIMSFFIMVGITACQKEDSLTSCSTFKSSSRLSTEVCGSIESYDIIKKNKSDVLGSMNISNDRDFVYVTINAAGGLNGIRLYYGDCNSIPTNEAHYGNLVTLSSQTSYTYVIDKNDVDSCACYVARVETNGVGLVSAQYCVQPCDECDINVGDYKTYGQGGYGSTPQGNNPGTYLENNFSQAFPNGISIGCNNTLTFTSAQNIRDFLPQGSTPAALSGSAVNPSNRYNVLAGQVLTLALNTVFDKYDSSFGNANGNLEDLKIASGNFAGMSVKQILLLANDVLGGCSTTYSPSEINDIVTAINENFEDGLTDGELLICP